MIFFSHQWATYYYINVVPQFQSINNGNWKHIENSVRRKAAQLKRELFVFTGAHEILELKNKKISLEKNALEVPKWMWKIIMDKESNAGIGFITFNNPFSSSATHLCKDICIEYGWDWKDRKSFTKGYTICCKIDELMSVIESIPNAARASHVLQM